MLRNISNDKIQNSALKVPKEVLENLNLTNQRINPYQPIIWIYLDLWFVLFTNNNKQFRL